MLPVVELITSLMSISDLFKYSPKTPNEIHKIVNTSFYFCQSEKRKSRLIKLNIKPKSVFIKSSIYYIENNIKLRLQNGAKGLHKKYSSFFNGRSNERLRS